RFQSRVEITSDHRQQDGFIHAGVMATMADHTAGYSAFTTVPDEMQILTVEFKVNFLRPAFGDSLVCRSQVIREGRQVIVSESEVFDIRPEGEVSVAKAMVTLMAVPRERLLRE
ncbi:MAG: PaaI family thioesterase, partial [Pseudomonadota bacterium]